MKFVTGNPIWLHSGSQSLESPWKKSGESHRLRYRRQVEFITERRTAHSRARVANSHRGHLHCRKVLCFSLLDFLSLFFCLVYWSIDRLIFFVIYLIYPGFATSSHSLELMIFLPLSLRCCDYRCDHKLCSVFLLELLQILQSSWYKRRESATAIQSPYRNYDHRPEEHLMVTQHKLSVIFIHSQNWDFLAIMMMFSWI